MTAIIDRAERELLHDLEAARVSWHTVSLLGVTHPQEQEAWGRYQEAIGHYRAHVVRETERRIGEVLA